MFSENTQKTSKYLKLGKGSLSIKKRIKSALVYVHTSADLFLYILC